MKSSKIILLPFIVCILLFSLPMKAIDMRSFWPSTTVMQDACDSLFIIDGRGYAVKNVTMTRRHVSFIVCDSNDTKVRKVPWSQVKYVKKADEKIITSKNMQENLPREVREENLEKEIKNLLILSAISFVLGLSFIIGIIVMIRIDKYRAKIKGHPKEKQLNRQLNWAVAMSLVLIIKGIVWTAVMIGFIIRSILIGIGSAFDNMFNFDYHYYDDPQ